MNSRRPRLKSPLNSARDAVLGFVLRPFKNFSPNTRFFIAFGVLVVITTLLLANTFSRLPVEDYREGEVVRRTVVAPADIPGIDITETDKRKEAARETIRPVFNLDPLRAASDAQSFRAAWEDLETQTEQARGTGSKEEPVWTGSVTAAEDQLNTRKAITRAIIAHGFDVNEMERLARLLREMGEGYVYEDSEGENLKQEIVLSDLRNNSQMVIAMPQSRMTALSVARRNLQSRVSQLSGWSQDQQTAIAAAMLPLLKPNVFFDPVATQNARDAAAARIEPVAIQIRRNQVVAREGDTVTPHMLAQFAAIRAYGRAGRRLHHIFGLLVLVGALFWLAWKFIEHRSTAVSLSLSKQRAFALVGSAVLVETLLMRIYFTFADSIAAQNLRAPLNDPTIWNFAIPFAMAALLVALLVDTQLALITALITSLFAGLMSPTGINTAFYAVISSAAAIYGIGRYRERQSVTLAGLSVGLVNAVIAVALISYAQQPLTFGTILLSMGCGFVGGLMTAVFVAGLLPVTESLFGILTDVKLLELSNADLPVLGQLALRAPGTNQHSHAVGQLAEEACRAIGANPLLARIGALYHDIGKTAAPEMFVENQQGKNPHDRLRPTQSARIITSHVTYGLKLAKEIGLPKQISDFIPQHHGTRTLHFFLRKAQALAAPNETVDEKEFRYPGPKPQFKETAIMMLADSCEAAARSLARPDPENISLIVTKIVDAIISDGQLAECDITLRELTTIRESIITSLTAIYHARIDYPGFNPPMTGPLPSPHLDTEERGISYSTPAEIPINEGGEVEDEAITRKAG
jgi:cyclic-di-AMP phosphodiesterase PgpH